MTEPLDPQQVITRFTHHAALIANLLHHIDQLAARIEHLEQHDTCSTSPMWLRETEPDQWNITDHD